MRAGLTDASTVKQLYSDYSRFLQANVKGTFTQLLLARGAIDKAGFNMLQERVPPATTGGGPPPPPPPDAGGGGVTTTSTQTWALPSWKSGDPLGADPQLESSDSTLASDSRRWGQAQQDAGHISARLTQSDLGRDSGRHKLLDSREVSRSPSPEPAPEPAQADPDLTLNYDRVLPAPAGSTSSSALLPAQPPAPPTAHGSGLLPAQPPTRPPSPAVIPIDSGSYDPLRDPLPPRTPAPEMVDSTAADSRGAPAPELSQDHLGLDLQVDPVQAREDEFFSVDSLSDEATKQGAAPEAEPVPGDVLGDYELLSILGRGGMGVIFVAKKLGTGEEFALKALNVGTGPTAAKRRQRFQREVDALRRLDHDNIVRVYTCGRKGQWDWYVMDRIAGRELKEVLRDGDLKPYDKLTIFIDLCKAIEHAHERNVIHRDLKPGNVLIGDDLHVWVLDFGLAKLSDEDLSLTRTGAALGTPYYMAPEQIINPKDVDYRVDIFSLGVMLFELMVGQRPFTGQTAGEVSNKIMNEDPPRPSLMNDKLYPAFDAMCFKAMDKDADRRYQHVDEFRRDVAKYRRGTGAAPGGVNAGVLIDSFKRYLEKNRNPVLVGVLIASLLYLPIILLMAT